MNKFIFCVIVGLMGATIPILPTYLIAVLSYSGPIPMAIHMIAWFMGLIVFAICAEGANDICDVEYLDDGDF